jgi:hypothetical protein
MANTLLTRLEITRKATRLFKNSNMFIQNIDRSTTTSSRSKAPRSAPR